MKSKIWEAAKPALILMLIAAVSAGALAGVNALTANTIADRSEAAANEARRQVIEAADFEAGTLEVDGETVTYHTAVDAAGETVGYVFSATVTGKSGGLVVMTGIAADGTVTGVTVTEDNETAGYVDKVEKGGLFAAFKGKVAALFTAGDNIDAVAQATKTSKGVISGVNQAVEWYTALTKGGESDEPVESTADGAESEVESAESDLPAGSEAEEASK